jgi:hypothetical protein
MPSSENLTAYQALVADKEWVTKYQGEFVVISLGMVVGICAVREQIPELVTGIPPSFDAYVRQVGGEESLDMSREIDSSIETESDDEEPDPGLIDLLDVIRFDLNGDEFADVQASETLEEAIGLTFTFLTEHGIEDPEAYLVEKGLLLP